ncbi:MAG: hypothetical protein JWR39_1848 [Devosia sp.]|nr:hypothetical protein [Devosia sp.]
MDHQSQLQSIRTLLLAEWDPIGVREEAAAQDEYDRYLPTILGLLQRHTSASVLAKYLGDVATMEMGLVGVEQRDRATAESLLRLRLT